MAVSKLRTTVGDYVTLVRGTTYHGNLVGTPGPALLGLGSIEPGGGFRIGHYKTYGGDCPADLMLFPGDIYASLKGATKDGKMIGSVARVPLSVTSGRLTQDTVRLVFREPNPENESYIYWMLRTPQYRDYCEGRATGSAVVALSRRDFLSYPILSLTNARKCVVRLLDEIEAHIEVNRRMNETLEALVRALFKSWFVDFDPVRAKAEGHDPNLSEALAHLFPGHFVASELGEIPQGWDVASIGNHVLSVKGKSYRSEDLKDCATALVTLKSFARGGGYRPDGLKAYTGEYKPEQVVKPGELIIACTDVTQAAEVIGKPALVQSNNEYEKLVASLDVMIVRSRNDAVSVPFLYCLFRDDRFSDHTYAHSTGTTVLHLAKDAVPCYRFVRPSKDVSKKFNCFSSQLFQRIDASEIESRSLAALRDNLLPKLVSGELRVKDAERIAGEAT